MTNAPRHDDPEKFIKSLDADDLRRLESFLSALRMVDGWCRINRALAKFFIIGGIAALIFFSQGLDAVKNILGMGGKH